MKVDDEGRTYEGEGDEPTAFYAFGEPVLAPADGIVVAASDGHRDYHRTDGWLDPRQRDLRGNYVVVEHDGGEYSLLAHLQQGSVAVTPGDRVDRGQQVGRCGHSGNSTEPHLHFQVQDHPNWLRAASLPVQFADVTTRFPDEEPVHHDRAYVHAGQLVANGDATGGRADERGAVAEGEHA